MHKRMFGAIAGLSLVVSVAACGDDDDPLAATNTVAVATTAAPATVAAQATTLPSADEPPSKIISLSPTATEMLFAVGASGQVLAVDDFSNCPECRTVTAGRRWCRR